jgi:hypothetical protein
VEKEGREMKQDFFLSLNLRHCLPGLGISQGVHTEHRVELDLVGHVLAHLQVLLTWRVCRVASLQFSTE